MVHPTGETLDIVRRLIRAIEEQGVHLSEVYLFGSCAIGSASPDSDIDVALVSPEFSGVRYFDIDPFAVIISKVDNRIEVHTFSTMDKENSLFFDHIRKTGIKVA